MTGGCTKTSKTMAVEPADLQRLYSLSTKLLEENDLVALLQRIVEASAELLGADKGTLHIYDEQGKGLKLVSQTGFNRHSLEFFKSDPVGFSNGGSHTDGGPRVIVE